MGNHALSLDSTRNTSAHCTTSKRDPSLIQSPKPRLPTLTGREELPTTQSLIKNKTGAWTIPLTDQHGRNGSTRTSMSSTENIQVLLFNHKHAVLGFHKEHISPLYHVQKRS